MRDRAIVSCSSWTKEIEMHIRKSDLDMDKIRIKIWIIGLSVKRLDTL